MASHLLWEQGIAGSSPVSVISQTRGVMVALEILVLSVGVRLPAGLWGLLSMAGNPVCIGAMGVRFSPPPPFRNRNSMVRVAAF